jgi:hypothetical protein
MKFIEPRPFAEPHAAARKLLDIVRGSIADSGLRHAYTGRQTQRSPTRVAAWLNIWLE